MPSVSICECDNFFFSLVSIYDIWFPHLQFGIIPSFFFYRRIFPLMMYSVTTRSEDNCVIFFPTIISMQIITPQMIL